MCGISGLISKKPLSEESLRTTGARMLSAIKHRGPDDHGTATFPSGVFLGHHRLSILDLSSAGHQPMKSSDGRFWIVFNGEIYNFRELRKNLEQKSYSFSSNSDTEVLLNLYVDQGPECLEKLRGMFAFAIWDELRQELFFARDRFGMKPFYYVQNHDFFAFGSELKSLYQTRLFAQTPRHDATAHFLRNGCLEAPLTLYNDFQSLLPGHYGIYKQNALSLHSYFSLDKLYQEASAENCSPEIAAKEIREALVESVQMHHVSDVPVGIFLSGGLDSTALVAALREFYQGPIKTFTIVFPETQWNEGDLARDAARHFKTDHQEIEITEKDFFSILPEFFYHMDQPTLDGINTFFIARMARKAGLKVALSGLGGDETLGGYSSFLQAPFFEYWIKKPWAVSLGKFLIHLRETVKTAKARELLMRKNLSLEDVWQTFHCLFTKEQMNALGISWDFKQEISPGLQHDFLRISRLEIMHFMIPQLLQDADIFSMASGLEIRTPFVDHIFLKKVLQVGRWPLKNNPSYKAALFKSMGNFLPSHHLKAKKKGFTFPFQKWLWEALYGNSKNDFSKDFFTRLQDHRYQPFLERFQKHQMHWSRLWAFYVLEVIHNKEY